MIFGRFQNYQEGEHSYKQLITAFVGIEEN